MQILDKYFDFCRNQKYISSREMMEEIIELLTMETDVTKNYINCCLGLHVSNLTSEEIDCNDTNMQNFIRTLPLHLNAKAVEVLNPDKYRDENKNGLNLYDDFYDMLGYIKDIERFNYRFVPVPDDDEKVFIEFKATIMGTNFEDLKYQFKKIKRNIKSELFEGAELLNNYLIFKRQKQYVSTRDVLSEIFNLLLQKTSVTKNYITREMGTSLNGYMYAEESDMDEFADTLPPHLKKLVKEVYTDRFPSEPPEEALGLHDDLYEMLGFITDIEKLQFHFSPKPFETDDENEPEIMEKVNIEINMSLVGTSAEDVYHHLKEIEGKTAEVGFVAQYIKN